MKLRDNSLRHRLSFWKGAQGTNLPCCELTSGGRGAKKETVGAERSQHHREGTQYAWVAVQCSAGEWPTGAPERYGRGWWGFRVAQARLQSGWSKATNGIPLTFGMTGERSFYPFTTLPSMGSILKNSVSVPSGRPLFLWFWVVQRWWTTDIWVGPLASLVAQMVKNLPAMQETQVQSPKFGRSPGGGHGNPLQYSCLENPMDRGTWWSIGSQRVRYKWVTNTLTFSLASTCLGTDFLSTQVTKNLEFFPTWDSLVREALWVPGSGCVLCELSALLQGSANYASLSASPSSTREGTSLVPQEPRAAVGGSQLKLKNRIAYRAEGGGSWLPRSSSLKCANLWVETGCLGTSLSTHTYPS